MKMSMADMIPSQDEDEEGDSHVGIDEKGWSESQLAQSENLDKSTISRSIDYVVA